MDRYPASIRAPRSCGRVRTPEPPRNCTQLIRLTRWETSAPLQEREPTDWAFHWSHDGNAEVLFIFCQGSNSHDTNHRKLKAIRINIKQVASRRIYIACNLKDMTRNYAFILNNFIAAWLYCSEIVVVSFEAELLKSAADWCHRRPKWVS